jgi:catechol 2,3-dioxygenase-like lactoylglutathione lyase family enzyme
MFSHVMVGSNDIARSKKFYDALFTAIGGQPGTEVREGRLAYTHNGSRFMVTKPNDGKPASSANGGTIGFSVGDPKLAEA